MGSAHQPVVALQRQVSRDQPVPQLQAIRTDRIVDTHGRDAVLVFSIIEFDAVVDQWLILGDAGDDSQPSHGAFHETRQVLVK